MAAQGTSKQSAHKTPAAPEEQNAIRRAKKAKQRHSPRQGRNTGSGYLAGLASDRIKERGVALLDRLDTHMTSASRDAMESLRLAMIAYVDSFTAENSLGYEKRHVEAKKRALSPLTGTLRTYAERQLDTAFKATRPGR